MQCSEIIPVILCGGSGTRLWPVSRKERPKQFLSLTSEETMLQMTLRCAAGIAGSQSPLIVAGSSHADLIEDQAAQIGVADALLLLEPCPRNTAPAIALAALVAENPNAALVVLPSDHVITDRPSFYSAIEAAFPLANDGWLITLGIYPDSPETGYGYIRLGAPLGTSVCKVEKFVEKPDRASAMQMLGRAGMSGMPVFSCFVQRTT